MCEISLVSRPLLDLGGVSETAARTPLLQEQGGAGAAGAGAPEARGQGGGGQGSFWD